MANLLLVSIMIVSYTVVCGLYMFIVGSDILDKCTCKKRKRGKDK